jgi:hypothetical protein
VYKPGLQNSNADALYRRGALNREVSDTEEIDEVAKGKLLHENHVSILGGHRVMHKTYRAIRQHYYWPNMKEKNRRVRETKCQLNKVFRSKMKARLEVTTTATYPFEKCSLDIVGPLVESESGNKYIQTFQVELNKFIVAIPLQHQDAETVTKALVLNTVLKFAVPAKILSDASSNILSNLFKNVCKLLRIRKMQSTTFHPESNGSLESSHRVLMEYLCLYVHEDQRKAAFPLVQLRMQCDTCVGATVCKRRGLRKMGAQGVDAR